MIQNNSYDADTLHEECGVFGMYDFDGADVASTIYYGLFALQHRGQESCGIAVSDTSGPKGKVLSYKGMGLVNEVFAPENLEQMKGDIGVGHVRYSTAGSSTRENAQPLVLNYVKGTLALAHNGNLINAPQLRKELEYTGAIFQTTIDSEVIAYYIARERLNSQSAEEAVRRACQRLKGAYALVVTSPRKLIGARDPYGFKPLCIGKRDNSYIITSETCALDTIGATFVRDCICKPDQGRKVSGTGFAGRGRSGDRCAGVRKCCSTWLFSGIRDSVWYSLCQEQLCGTYVYQAKAEQQGIQRTGEAECAA